MKFVKNILITEMHVLIYIGPFIGVLFSNYIFASGLWNVGLLATPPRVLVVDQFVVDQVVITGGQLVADGRHA